MCKRTVKAKITPGNGCALSSVRLVSSLARLFVAVLAFSVTQTSNSSISGLLIPVLSVEPGVKKSFSQFSCSTFSLQWTLHTCITKRFSCPPPTPAPPTVVYCYCLLLGTIIRVGTWGFSVPLLCFQRWISLVCLSLRANILSQPFCPFMSMSFALFWWGIFGRSQFHTSPSIDEGLSFVLVRDPGPEQVYFPSSSGRELLFLSLSQ